MTLVSRCAAIFTLGLITLTSFRSVHSQTTAPAETSNLAAATIREALTTERARTASHPKEAQNYIDLAYTLVDAGITEQAAQQMRRAVEVAPRSALAYQAQGWVLTHNSIGVQYGRGFDYDGACAAYRKAVALDPGGLSARKSLAETLAYNRKGVQHATDAKMDESIDLLRFIKAHQNERDEDPDVEDNLLINLFYEGRFAEVLPELQGFNRSPKRDGITLAAIAALKGSALAVERANQTAEEDKRKEALTLAAEGLWNMRLYPQAADLPATDPRSPVQRLLVAAATDTLSEQLLDQCVSRHSFANDEEWKRSLPQANFLTGRLHTLSRQTGLPQVVLQDILLNQIKITSTPSKGQGTRVTVQAAGLPATSFYVLREEADYKIVAVNNAGDAGTEALFLLHHQQEAAAIALLDWKRESTEINQGDDPLGGQLFARLWKPGQDAPPTSTVSAAASLITDKPTLLELLPGIVEARKRATRTADRNNLDLLLATIYLRVGDSAKATQTCRLLLEREPDSATAVALMGRAYQLTGDWSAWKTLVDRQLQQHPNDRPLLLQSAAEAEAQGDYARARSALRTILDSGHGLAEDQNRYAWLALFADNVDDLAIQAAEQAGLSTRQENSAYLHTLACLYAARGQTALARQFLLDAMSAAGLEEPTGPMWYGFGRIYEQYGNQEAAITAYRRVEAPTGVPQPTDTFVLAQQRLTLLHAT